VLSEESVDVKNRIRTETHDYETKIARHVVSLLKFRVFWYVLPCTQVDVDRRFRDPYCLHHQGDE
jgi:hypothetical protein